MTLLNIVTIDGPAGAGKSTVARQLAERLGYRFLDTGAMYRVVTALALEAGLSAADEAKVTELAGSVDIDFGADGSVSADGEILTTTIRSDEVTRSVSAFAAIAGVRHEMAEAQRRIGERGELVCEGRDMGSFVFPNAAVRIYLDASAEVRAERRGKELEEAGRDVDYAALLEEIRNRDRADSERETAPLVRLDDQIYVDSSAMSREEVIDTLERLAREGLGDARG